MKVRLECRHHNDLFAHFHSHFWSAAISWTSLNFTFSSPELRLFLSCLDYICPLWKSAMFKTKSAYGSHGLGLLPLPGEKYCSISLTNGKPIEIEKPTIIPQLKTKAPMWSQHFGTTFSLPSWLPDQIWSFGMGDMLCLLVTQRGTKAFVVFAFPLNPLGLYLQLLGPSLQL